MAKKKIMIGLTGGLATGKTEVLSLFKRWGFPVASADDFVHTCYRRGHPVTRAVVRRWGREVLDRQGNIDRAALGHIVFRSAADRRRLERLVHPWVLKGMRAFAKRQSRPVVLEIPLLFEVGWQKWLDRIIVVDSSKVQQIKRLQKRNGLSRSEVLLRLKSQWPLRRKIQKADFVIRNRGSRAALARQVRTLAAELQGK